MAKKKPVKVRSARVQQQPIDPFEVEHSLDMLVRAEKIKQDPAMMKRVKAEITKREKALKKIKK